MNDAQSPVHPDQSPTGRRVKTGSASDRDTRYEIHDVEAHFDTFDRGTVITLGLAGMAVETAKHFSIRGRYPIRLKGSDGSVRVTARVVSSRLVGTVQGTHGEIRPVYRADLQFVGLSKAQQRGLEAFVDRSEGSEASGDVSRMAAS